MKNKRKEAGTKLKLAAIGAGKALSDLAIALKKLEENNKNQKS